MDNWFLPKITDYWDWTRDSLEKYAAEIMMASPEVRAKSLSAIREAITEHVRVLPERILLNVLCTVADDSSFVLAVKSLVIGNENQFVTFPIVPVSSHRAIQYIILGINLHVFFFAPTLQESAEN